MTETVSSKYSHPLNCKGCKTVIGESEASVVVGRPLCSACARKEEKMWSVIGAGFVICLLLLLFSFLFEGGQKPEHGVGERQMTQDEQATLQRLQDVWRETCVRRGYDAYSQECAFYVTQKTVEFRKDAGLW